MMHRQTGFTLMELLVVLWVLALCSVMVAMQLPSSLSASMDQEVDRVAAALEAAKALARSRHTPLQWVTDRKGFSFSLLNDASAALVRMDWLVEGTQCDPAVLVLSAEPVQSPMRLTLRHPLANGQTWGLGSDGAHGFQALN